MLREACDGTAFRLIGIGAGDLCPASFADRGDLLDGGIARTVAREAALDRVRERFGAQAIQRGISFTPVPRTPPRGRS